MAINTPKPISREEKYLDKIGGNEKVIVPKPISREEKYMYRAAGYNDQPIPDYPIGRNEKYWAKIVENGGGSGNGSTVTFDSGQKFISDNSSLKDYKIYGNGREVHPIGVLPLTFTAKGGTAVDWVIYGNDENGTENLFDISKSGMIYIDTTKQRYGNSLGKLQAGTYTLSFTRTTQQNLYVTKRIGNVYSQGSAILSSPYSFDIANNVDEVIVRSTMTSSTTWEVIGFVNIMVTRGSTAPDHYIPHQQGVGEQRVDGYYVPIKVTKHKSYPIQWELKGKAVRDQVTSTKGNEILTWDVIGIDHDECYYADGRRAAHSVTLQLHDCFASLQFDEREALFYAESAMPAGTYHFTVREQPWYASDVGKTFQFTLTQTLAAGSQICITNAYNATMTSGKIKTFSDGSSTTAIETVDITEGSDGTDLGDVRNALVGQNTNSIQRALLGSNNWANSAMRQWLNSSAAAGSVWMTKTKFDRSPSWASSTAGFLNGMDEDFVNAVGTVKKTTALNTVTDGGGKVESDERFFLLSRSEVYGGNEVAGGEGAAYSYYADYSDLSGAGTGADTNRIKYRNGAAQYWWLRSPYATCAHSVRRVHTAGGVSNDDANCSLGVAPVICIPMDEVYDCNEVDIYIGDSPLTEGETVSKTSTGQDIELFEGENTVSTTLYNKPTMEIETSYGVGVKDNNHYIIPFKVNTTIYNIQIGDSPLYYGEYLSYKEKKLYKYIDSVLTPIDPPSPFPEISTTEGVNKVIIETSTQPDSIFITTQNPIKLVQPNIGTKTITQNGVYNASDDNLDGYSSVTVNTN